MWFPIDTSIHLKAYVPAWCLNSPFNTYWRGKTLTHVRGVTHSSRAVRDFFVQILPKAPNLAHMLPKPYFLDFWSAPRRTTSGAAILAKSNMATTRVEVTKQKIATLMNNTTFMRFWGSGNMIMILFHWFDVIVTSQGHHWCHFAVRTGCLIHFVHDA